MRSDVMHPRPHLVRRTWLSLDGAWDFVLDPRDVGEVERWFSDRREWPLRIEVPYPWESPRSGVGGPAPDRYVRGEGHTRGGTGWYRRQVEIPADWDSQRVWLVIGAAYWRSDVWVDGRFAGSHENGYSPFDLDISDLIGERGTCSIVIRVSAPDDTDEYPHGKNTRHWYTRASGIWQSVFLEPRPPTHVERLEVVPDPDSQALKARVWLRSGAGANVGARLDVLLRGALVATRTEDLHVAQGLGEHHMQVAVPSPSLWTPDTPTLYDVRVTVAPHGETEDVVETSVGFRTIDVGSLPRDGPRWLHLNGEPLYVRAVMSQGYHPEGIMAYPDEATIREDLRWAKRLGFNMVRLHVKLEDPRVLAWADRIGILLWCEVPNFLTPSREAMARWEDVWRAMLERDAGHPSIALWCMFIESWGLGTNQFGFGCAERRFADDKEMQDWVVEMYALGRALDPTRPIIENSVCEADHTVAEINDIHLFPVGYGDLQAVAGGVLSEWLAATYPGSGCNYVPGYSQGDQPLMVTSMAGWSCVDGVETSWPFRALVNEVRARERIAGYGWVQLYDVEWEMTGILDYRREPKELGYDITRVNADDVLVVHGPLARSVRAGDDVVIDLGLAHASDRALGRLRLAGGFEGHGDAWQSVRTPVVGLTDRVIHGRGVTHLGPVRLAAPEAPFAGNLVLEAIDADGSVVAATVVHIAVLQRGAIRSTDVELPPERWISGRGQDLDTIVIEGGVQRVASRELTCQFRLPEVSAPNGHAEVYLVAEAAVELGGRGGRDARARELPVQVLLDRDLVGQISIPSLRADSSGVLSIIHPDGLGSYGGPLRTPLGPHGSLAGKTHELTLRCVAAGVDARIMLFGARLGRAPTGPRLVLSGGGSARMATAEH